MDNLITQINRFQPETPVQQQAKEQFIQDLYKHGERLFYREQQQTHVTAGSIILNPRMDKVLMVFHNIYQSFSWTGGHADGEQNLLEVAIKEAKEETGIKNVYPITTKILSIDILPVPWHCKNGVEVPAHSHFCAAYGLICSEEEALSIKPDENSAVRWIGVDDELELYCTEEEMLPIYRQIVSRMKAIVLDKQTVYASLPERLLEWYGSSARVLPWREDKEPYHVWLSEIMLQQTRVDTVKGYYIRFLQELPSIAALAEADEEKVLKLWEGLGYYSRARNLQKTAKIIMEQYSGVFPVNYADIVSLPGIGAYTAGAVASICFEQPVPAVDGNVLRVMARLTENFLCIDDETTKKQIAMLLSGIYPPGRCGDFTQSLMELGATVCLPNGVPQCSKCPVRELCMAYQNDSAMLLPVKKQKTARKITDITVYILRFGTRTAIRKRTEPGVLSGSWEFPNTAALPDAPEVQSRLKSWQDNGYRIVNTVKGKHIFTHIQWNMTCYFIDCPAAFGDYRWVEQEELENEIALPTAFKKFWQNHAEELRLF